MTQKCKECKEFKVRKRWRRMPNCRHFYYVDGSNRTWLKKVCPDCKDPVDTLDLDPLTQRKCRNCSSFLRTSRYFTCRDCTRVHPSYESKNLSVWTEEDWGYGVLL